MARRAPYTRVEKVGQERPAHVRGMGDVVFKGFQCLNGTCESFLVVPEADIGVDFSITCPTCGYEHVADGETKFFDYRLIEREPENLIETGEFVILHDDYISEAQRFKYCLLCYALKPLDRFDVHNSRKSGRQGECRLCKTIYNGIKNQSRTTDQHREASQRRRLYGRLAGQSGTIESRTVFDKFGGRCFSCDRELEYGGNKGRNEFQIDHTLPARLLWPTSTRGATLLCPACNNEKHANWPSEFYEAGQLRRLARLTDYPYNLLAGPPVINPVAMHTINTDPEGFVEDWIRYPDEIRRIRDLILEHTGEDIFEGMAHVPEYLRQPEQPQQ